MILEAQDKMFKALGHPSRLRMLKALQNGEKCVCELKTLIGHDMSTVSKHLSLLKEAGLVVTEKRGTSIYYRLCLCCLETFLSCSEDLIRQRIKVQAELLRE